MAKGVRVNTPGDPEKQKAFDKAKSKSISNPDFEFDDSQAAQSWAKQTTEKQANPCPACGAGLVVTERRKYKVNGTTTAEYTREECLACGFVLHHYAPPVDPGFDLSDDIPF